MRPRLVGAATAAVLVWLLSVSTAPRAAVTGWGSPKADRLAAALLDGDTATAADPGYRRHRR